ncbi:MAG: hypothetical protein CFE38_20300 [Comamonadaceae bacterium PBBC1]|nr:MAG: hypothetical protein CFE38_20300 [Comamonadaceae bacterium PBBC1]
MMFITHRPEGGAPTRTAQVIAVKKPVFHFKLHRAGPIMQMSTSSQTPLPETPKNPDLGLPQ